MDKQKKFTPVRISYDREADVLYVSMGAPKESICDIEDNGVIFRRDPVTKKITGLTIIDFTRNFSSEKAKIVNPHLTAQFQFV